MTEAATTLDRNEQNDGKNSGGRVQHQMVCMEVWGGNTATDRMLELFGLNCWVYNQPYQQASGGGDVYYVSNCATGRITRLMLADVSGHGAAVADIASRLRDLMRRYVNHIEQVKFVRSMNYEFSNQSHSGKFATAVVATFFAPTCELTLSNAGHPPPLVYRAATRTWHLIDLSGTGKGDGPTNLPLGIFEEGDYSEFQVALNPLDVVLIYSDALIESHNKKGELLGTKGLLEIVSQLDGSQPEKLFASLRQVLTSLDSRNLAEDDVTLLLFRPAKGSFRVPIKNRILAPIRFLWGMMSAMIRGGRGMPLPEFSWRNLGGAICDRFSSSRKH